MQNESAGAISNGVKMKVFLDGKWLTLDKARAPIDEPGFLYAQGVFETMRADNEKIFRLEAHLERLTNSSKLVKISLGYSKAQLKDIIERAVSLNKYSCLCLRLTVWQGLNKAHLSVITRKYRPYPQKKYISGFKAIFSSITQNETNFLANIKASARLHFLLAEQEAKNKGMDEAILLNTKGDIAEGARSNIFLVKDGALHTPDKESGSLLGITRNAVLDIAKGLKIKTYERKIKPSELFSADEAFLTNSLIGIMPLPAVEKKKIGSGKIGRLTADFAKRYQENLKKG
jgi:branched-subunit amino acid aminotransferase/4-amino-4-deoxychorismate lyase